METFTLENKFEIVYEKPKNVIPIAAIYLFIKQGSVNEINGIRGGSHFIEHMCFKGTKKIPNSKILSTKFDEIGAYFNAFTSKYITCYTVKCAEFFVENCLQIMSDMVLNSRFSKNDFDKEQNIVKEETIKDESDEETQVSKFMDNLLYSGSSLAFPIDDISYHQTTFDYKTITQLYHESYQPGNMVLSVVTHIPFSTIKKMLNRTFFIQKRKYCLYDSPIYTSINSQTDINFFLHKSPVEKSVYLAIGFRTCSEYNTDKYALQVLSTVLAGTMSGRLFILLREKNAVTYSSNVDTNHYSYSGDFIISTSSDCNKIIKNGSKPGVLPLIIHEINNIIKYGITDKELHTAKGYLKGKSMMSLENCENQALYNGEYAIMEKYNPKKTKFVNYTDIYETYIDPIKLSDIKRVIHTYFQKTNMSVVLSGKNIPKLETVKTICQKIII
jgi:predicted Zn-dependent peptidase